MDYGKAANKNINLFKTKKKNINLLICYVW